MAIAVFLLSLYFPWALAWVESRKDSRRILRWNHYMREAFHFKYGLLRGLVLLLGTGLFAWYHWGGWALITACLAYQVCGFGYNFTSMLNEARNKERWYQSRQADAAWVDRTFVSAAQRLKTTPELLAQRVYTFLGKTTEMAYFAAFILHLVK